MELKVYCEMGGALRKVKKVIDVNLLGPCGVYCGYCLALKKGICSGCRYEADEQAQRGSKDWCTLLNCTERRHVKECSDCDEFPCREYDPEGTGMYSRMYIDYINNKMKPAGRRP